MERVIAIVGATATGKSALALDLAARWGGEIVNADALALYRGLDIGTAKPTAAARRAVTHHLLDVAAPDEAWSAARYATAGRAVLADLAARGAIAWVAGGSGFYLQALLDGLGEIPPTPSPVRQAIAGRLLARGPEALWQELAAVDPESAARLSRRDRQRVGRALEVWEATGRSLSEWRRAAPLGRDAVAALRIGLTLPRALLYDRIEERTRAMIAAGWIDEVRELLASGVAARAPAFQAIGYREIVAHLAGSCGLSATTVAIAQATRRYAKRQETWFRRDPRVCWFDARDGEAIGARVRSFLGAGGHGGSNE